MCDRNTIHKFKPRVLLPFFFFFFIDDPLYPLVIFSFLHYLRILLLFLSLALVSPVSLIFTPSSSDLLLFLPFLPRFYIYQISARPLSVHASSFSLSCSVLFSFDISSPRLCSPCRLSLNGHSTAWPSCVVVAVVMVVLRRARVSIRLSRLPHHSKKREREKNKIIVSF